jgi:hypothetical protein
MANYCSSCRTSEEIQQGLWRDVEFSQTPCSKCTLKEDSYGTLEYKEGHPANSSEDNPDDEAWITEVADDQSPQPYAVLDGETPDDPRIPLSSLVSAMSLFLSLSLPARKILQLRMRNVPYSAIGERLGCSRQAVEKLLAQALAKQPLLQNLLPAKSGRPPAPITTTHSPAIAEHDSGVKKCITALQKPRFPPNCATRDSA